MIFFNWLGLGMVIGAVGIAMVVSGTVTGEWDSFGAAGFFVCGCLALAVDLSYRVTQFREDGRWRFLKPNTGGSFCFIPVWGIGVVWLIVGAVDFAKGGDEVRARNDTFMKETERLLQDTVVRLRNAKTRTDREAANAAVDR